MQTFISFFIRFSSREPNIGVRMELLRLNLSRVRIPESSSCIFKQECCISFDNPKSEGGLYVDMNSFIAFGKDYVMWNYEKTGNTVYLHIKQTKVVPEERPLKKPMVICLEGVYEETRTIVILPDFVTLAYPWTGLPKKVRQAIFAIISSEGTEMETQMLGWLTLDKRASAHAWNLKQIRNGVPSPPSAWKCAKCDKTENLWLNLTDGMILCGRENLDGTGGNDHAFEHYNETGYPLVVKLGIRTSDPGSPVPDVYSYEEGASVMDPLLPKHLAFLCIDFSLLQKIDQTTAEREWDQNAKFDSNRIQEIGEELKPLFGPGYTGLVNLYKSCYLASIMQVTFATNSFISRYYTDKTLKAAFEEAPADPALDFNMQMTKLAHGLLSGDFSNATTEKQKGIHPHMFKTVMVRRHSNLYSMRQQDAHLFFNQLIFDVECDNCGNPELDPSRSFKFGFEDRFEFPSGKVARYRNVACSLSLNIPLDKATNQEELQSYNKLKAGMLAARGKLDAEKAVRPTVPLLSCLESYLTDDDDMYISEDCTDAINKTVSLISFPDYLSLHMRRFVLDDDTHILKKLDVYIDVPDIIDINFMRTKERQEELSSENDTLECDLEPVDASLPDGPGNYKLLGFVSHIGTSTEDGHYVAHIRKDGRWVIFNDEKVEASVNPPTDMGYLYFFERLCN